MRFARKRIAQSLIVIAVAFVLLNALVFMQARALTHFVGANAVKTDRPERLTFPQKLKVMLCGVDIPRPVSTLTPDALNKECRSVIIPGARGIRLGGWYCPGPSGSPIVLLFHGHASEKTATLPVARAFLAMGYSILMVDFRGSGDSSESYTTIGYFEGEDVASAVNYARTALPHRKLYLYGVSMGAAAILRAVDGLGVTPDAILVEAVYDSLLNTVENRFDVMRLPSFPLAHLMVFWGGVQEGFNAFSLQPMRYASSVRCPILFLHGTADTRARLEDAHRVFAAVTSPKQFKEFADVGHDLIIAFYPEEWKRTVKQFLNGIDGN